MAGEWVISDFGFRIAERERREQRSVWMDVSHALSLLKGEGRVRGLGGILDLIWRGTRPAPHLSPLPVGEEVIAQHMRHSYAVASRHPGN